MTSDGLCRNGSGGTVASAVVVVYSSWPSFLRRPSGTLQQQQHL